VLEFGAGGSTVFFASRAKSVMSFDNSQAWADKVMVEVGKRNLHNVVMHVAPRTVDIPDLSACKFDVCLVDCCEIDRRYALKLALGLMRPEGLIAIDNYAADYCEGIEETLHGYPAQVNFDDTHWAGRGTKIVYIKGGKVTT
jgi:predicted O-methyltransferase YrrM